GAKLTRKPLGRLQRLSAIGLGSTGSFMQQVQDCVSHRIQLTGIFGCCAVLATRDCGLRLIVIGHVPPSTNTTYSKFFTVESRFGDPVNYLRHWPCDNCG